MNSKTNVVATIDGLGTIEAKNDLAIFSLTIRAKNDTLEAAQKQVEDKTKQAIKELENNKMQLDGEMAIIFSNYKLEHREGSERYSAGFQSVNVMTFTVKIDDNLDGIYKTCLKIDPAMSCPLFAIKDREVLVQQALQKATDDVKSKLNKECALLDVSSSSLKINDWVFGYQGELPMSHDSAQQFVNHSHYLTKNGNIANAYDSRLTNAVIHGQVAAGAAPTKVGSIYQELLDPKLIPGMTTVSIAVRVNYVWKE